MELIWISEAKHIKDYLLELTFNNGVSRIIDLFSYIEARPAIFSPLLNLDVFKNFKLNDWTICWLDGKIDIAPERLYEMEAL